MQSNVTYTRYYFSKEFRLTFVILFVPLVVYLIFIAWFMTAIFCILLVLTMWTFKNVLHIDLSRKKIKEQFYRFGVPSGDVHSFEKLNYLLVTSERKKYKAASRSRDYWVNYTEFSLQLNYDQNKRLVLLIMNDPDEFKTQVKKFAKSLQLRVKQ